MRNQVADVDLGHVAGRHFANLTSLGLSVQVAEHVPHLLKRIVGRAAYPLTALALLPRHRPFTARLRLIEATGDDGEMTGMTVENGTDRTGGEDRGVHELVTHQLNIANGSHHAGRATDPCCVSGQLNGTGLARPPVRSRPRPG